MTQSFIQCFCNRGHCSFHLIDHSFFHLVHIRFDHRLKVIWVISSTWWEGEGEYEDSELEGETIWFCCFFCFLFFLLLRDSVELADGALGSVWWTAGDGLLGVELDAFVAEAIKNGEKVNTIGQIRLISSRSHQHLHQHWVREHLRVGSIHPTRNGTCHHTCHHRIHSCKGWGWSLCGCRQILFCVSHRWIGEIRNSENRFEEKDDEIGTVADSSLKHTLFSTVQQIESYFV